MAFSQSPDFFKRTDLADCKACLADGSRHRLIALAAALKSNEDFSCFCLKIWRIPSILHESKFGEPNPCRFLDMNPRYGRLMERWGSLGSLSPSRYPRSYECHPQCWSCWGSVLCSAGLPRKLPRQGIEPDPFIDGLAITNGEEGNSNNNFRAY